MPLLPLDRLRNLTGISKCLDNTGKQCSHPVCRSIRRRHYIVPVIDIILGIIVMCPRWVITDTPKTGIEECLATITSGIVDMPTASAPIIRKYLYSDGVSYEGPVPARYTPFLSSIPSDSPIFTARESGPARKDGSYPGISGRNHRDSCQSTDLGNRLI